ncbi:MAG TPA: SCO family protein [Polyangiaceae bacterium]|nr:SCO family protein [Polyangiaceae bacterium]
MRRRRRLRALALAAALLAGLPLSGVAIPSARAEVGAPPAVERSGLDRRLGARLPLDVRFRSSAGLAVALGDVLARDRPALVVLAYNRCTMLCSLVLRRVARLVTELGLRPGDDYTLVAISIDPRDTPLEASRLQGLLLEAAGIPGQPERWPFLVGEQPAIDAVASAIGFRYSWDAQSEQYAHPALITALGPAGDVAGYFDGLDPDPDSVRATLLGSRTSGGALGAVLSSCFRFDAARSRYGAALAWLLRASAAGLSVGLGLFVWRLARRRSRQEGAEP